MSRGVLLHAYNNQQIDYGLIAFCNALMIKHHLKVPICLVTDIGTIQWLKTNQDKALVSKVFDEVIPITVEGKAGMKRFCDTPSTTHTLPWLNTTRSDSYGLSPFDETLLIDSDYFVMDKSLNCVWGTDHDMMINRNIIPLNHGPVPERETWLDQTGIRLCWATCVYFRKSPLAEMVFDMVKHIKEFYSYYSMVYGFPTQLYRNDYAFSIAVHMLNGFVECDDIPSLPFPSLITSFDCDELIDVPALDEMVFYVNDRKEQWKFRLARTMGTNVHVLNKFSIIRQAEKIIKLYGEAIA